MSPTTPRHPVISCLAGYRQLMQQDSDTCLAGQTPAETILPSVEPEINPVETVVHVAIRGRSEGRDSASCANLPAKEGPRTTKNNAALHLQALSFTGCTVISYAMTTVLKGRNVVFGVDNEKHQHWDIPQRA